MELKVLSPPPLLLNSDLLPISPRPAANYDRAVDVEAFEETKAGVKGLVDSGLTTIPRFFIHPPDDQNVDLELDSSSSSVDLPPVIDMGIGSEEELVKQIREAAGTWGFFQIVNHGVAAEVMEEILASTRRFHELPEEKMVFYSRDTTRAVRYMSNGRLLDSTAPADWRDTLVFNVPDGTLDPQSVPPICREAVTEYLKQTIILKNKLAELLSEAAGLSRDYLSNIKCMETEALTCHYYPICPQPHLTLGASKHTDPSFLTIVLQDDNGGLQLLHRNRWVDMPKVEQGALLVNIGDFLQLITNDKFKSVEHRVRAQSSTARSSVVCFFRPSSDNKCKPYGPAKELLCDANPPVYKDAHLDEYFNYFKSGDSPLSHFKLA